MGDLHKLAPPPAAGRLRFKLTKFVICLGLILLLVVFLMGGWQLLAIRLQKVVAASWGVVEKGCWTDVLYLREEQLLTAPANGTLTLQVKSGARVPQGEILGLLDRNSAWGRNVTVKDSDRQSYNQYQTLLRQETALNFDLHRINRDILKRLKNPAQGKNSSDLQALQQEKEQVIRNIQVIHAQSVSLEQELAPLMEKWQFITAVKPGSFVTKYDGWENKLTPEYLEKLSPGDFTRNYPLKSCGRQVRTGETFGRLTNPFNQILAVKITAGQMGGIPEVGAVWRFMTEEGWKNAPLTYVRMFNRQTGVAGVALQADEVDLTEPRRSRKFVMCQKITGVIVPVQALFKNGQRTVVRVVKGGGYCEKPVRILGSDGSKTVVSGIEVGAMIISR